jgi:hypothetical protein
VEGTERPDSLRRESSCLDQLLSRRYPAQLLREQGGDPSQPAQVRGTVEGEAHRPAVAGDRRLNGLTDPPDRVRDELHPPVRIELPGSRHQADVPLTDEVHQRDAAVLELLRD